MGVGCLLILACLVDSACLDPDASTCFLGKQGTTLEQLHASLCSLLCSTGTLLFDNQTYDFHLRFIALSHDIPMDASAV